MVVKCNLDCPGHIIRDLRFTMANKNEAVGINEIEIVCILVFILYKAMLPFT